MTLRNKKNHWVYLSGLLGVLYMSNAWSETGAFIQVSAKIVRGCALQASPQVLDFGSHPSNTQGQKTAVVRNSLNSWRIECTANIPVQIELGVGQHYDAATQSRRLGLANEGVYLPYRLFYDPNYSQEIIANQSRTYRSTTQNELLGFEVYGVTDLTVGPANKTPGTYTDQVLITVKW